MSLPRLVVAAPASGHGKTTVATGLMAALRQRGLRVSGHKVGPDYIDAGYHAVATGRPARNLDPYLQGEPRIVPLLLHGARTPLPADVAVVEGAMGLFDGVVGSGDLASTAHVARLLRAPVLLVVDASSAGHSVAALVHGFRGFDPRVSLGGVVLNQVASDRHEALLREALGSLGVPVLGVLRRDAAVGVPSRHLGLVPAAERAPQAVAVADRLAAVVARSVDLEAVLALARTAPPLDEAPWSPAAEVGAPQARAAAARLAVAGGAAFTFSYTEDVELLTAAGLEVVPVDPLVDERLPPGVEGLVVGGGFPELHAQALSDNDSLRADVHRLASRGGVLVAECAGLLYLARSLEDRPMCGVLDVSAQMGDRLVVGYREARAASTSPVAEAGEVVRGHEFHRTQVRPQAGARAAWSWSVDGAPAVLEGFVQGRVHASYLHTHGAGRPHAARRLADALLGVRP